MTTPGQLVVNALLCDAAQAVGDKLYILGGGWSYVWPAAPRAPIAMALAVHLAVPWSMANQRLSIDARLVTEDGEQVNQEFGEVRAQGQIEAGRPPGVRHGTSLALPFTLNFPALQLDYGGYAWEIEIDGHVLSRVPFQVAEPPGAPTG